MTTGSRLALDTAMMTVLAALCFPAATGMAVHEWAGVAIAAAFLVHVALNGRRVVSKIANTARRIRFSKAAGLAVDGTLGAAGVTAVLSGLARSVVIGPTLGYGSASGGMWTVLHVYSGWSALALGSLHLALHWRWVLAALSTLSPSPAVAGHSVTPTRRPTGRPARRPARGLSTIVTTTALAAVFAAAIWGGALAGQTLAAATSDSRGTTAASTVVAQGNAGSTAAASDSGSSSSSQLTCPRTGCTASTCHHAH